jgi:FkbM family methyltransferase
MNSVDPPGLREGKRRFAVTKPVYINPVTTNNNTASNASVSGNNNFKLIAVITFGAVLLLTSVHLEHDAIIKSTSKLFETSYLDPTLSHSTIIKKVNYTSSVAESSDGPSKQAPSAADVDVESDDTSHPLKPLEQCTSEQLKIIATQLPPDDCLQFRKKPWMQKCSFTYATRCPDALWLEDFYTNIHSKTSSIKMKSPFFGIFIGCNKGFDAFNSLRMGSGNRHFEKSDWREAIYEHVGGASRLHHSVCGQDNEPQFPLPESSPDSTNSDAMVHCIEPMPQTYDILSRTAVHLNVTKNFKVVNAAFSQKDGSIPFPKGIKVGQENKGIANCNGANDVNCENVKMYSLDTYVDENLPTNATINYLSVDVEGFDSEVLLGGYRTALSRTQYLEFEYNWMGPWKNQKLSTFVSELENNFGFACYWPGTDGNIWRITKCFLEYYDIHSWSNVACVNRRIDEALPIAEKMESMFVETLKKGNDVVMDSNFMCGKYRTGCP